MPFPRVILGKFQVRSLYLLGFDLINCRPFKVEAVFAGYVLPSTQDTIMQSQLRPDFYPLIIPVVSAVGHPRYICTNPGVTREDETILARAGYATRPKSAITWRGPNQ